VLPSFAFYDDDSDQYVLKLWPPLEGFPSGEDAADARTMNASVEEAIREAPAQYLWTMRMFRTRPDGAAPPYAAVTAGRPSP
jgi:Kdo2-lipid IVA lauroyltransferase/acyltransferase